ncbi:interleukin-9 receptor-like [Sphaerodactylus townsendi]|uniref:interleukin-9 receptor-like n=1 Tax=Sphaerodactylus townsendi TaxID=933632 RepID=UPI0020265E3D|nr:interleukin-9 receptor-like [Sphaerodactylus townsendi]XP_048351594.1 interleukin-9 receptor-like [Sphaerodactylus townsendi]
MGKENLLAAHLLQVLLSPLLLAAERQQTGLPSGVRCLNNYGIQDRQVDCSWHRNQTAGEGAFYLNFSDTFQQYSDLFCWLSASEEAPHEFSCSAEGSGNFEEGDEYKLSLRASLGKGDLYTAWEVTYQPMQNIKCDPPCGVWSNLTASKCQIVWRKPEAYVNIWKTLQWQLQFRDTEVPWEQAETKTVVTRETMMEIDASEFTPGTSYVARVRCKTPDDSKDYASQWSEWSATTEWSVPPGPLLKEELPVLVAVFISACLGSLLFLLLLSSCYSRIKIRCSANTPSPADFFMPLYSSHHGNFQAWTGIKGRDAWQRGSKECGTGILTLRPVEAISQLSSVKRLSGVELPAAEGLCRLPGAPDQPDTASDYVVMQGEAKAPVLPGRAPLYMEALGALGESFLYLPYKNALFAEQDPWEIPAANPLAS